eukprot:gene12613-biopygen3433
MKLDDNEQALRCSLSSSFIRFQHDLTLRTILRYPNSVAGKHQGRSLVPHFQLIIAQCQSKHGHGPRPIEFAFCRFCPDKRESTKGGTYAQACCL